MGVIVVNLLKFFQCATWAEGDDHGGDIDPGNQIVSGANAIFDNVTDEERVAGMTDYRKIFFRNENADTYTNTKCWIAANTPAENDSVAICPAGKRSTTSTPVALPGTATFTHNSTKVVTTVPLMGEVVPGEKIFATADGEGRAIAIASIDGTLITLASPYQGSGGAGVEASVAGADTFTYVQPSSRTHEDALDLGDVAPMGAAGIWIKRVVTPGGEGYTNNTFTIKVENS
jgi:hypothetical protein